MDGTFIFVCDRGFVLVAKARLHEMAMHWHLPRSATIRRWGTTTGLAQLKDGPIEGTVLDTVCERTLPFRSVIDIIHLTKKGVEKWNKRLHNGGLSS